MLVNDNIRDGQDIIGIHLDAHVDTFKVAVSVLHDIERRQITPTGPVHHGRQEIIRRGIRQSPEHTCRIRIGRNIRNVTRLQWAGRNHPENPNRRQYDPLARRLAARNVESGCSAGMRQIQPEEAVVQVLVGGGQIFRQHGWRWSRDGIRCVSAAAHEERKHGSDP
jgi:hypothetical protein